MVSHRAHQRSMYADYMRLQNPYWGTPTETHDKVKEYYASSVMKPQPVSGAFEGAQALRELGYRLIIVTARHEEERVLSERWVDQYFPSE